MKSCLSLVSLLYLGMEIREATVPEIIDSYEEDYRLRSADYSDMTGENNKQWYVHDWRDGCAPKVPTHLASEASNRPYDDWQEYVSSMMHSEWWRRASEEARRSWFDSRIRASRWWRSMGWGEREEWLRRIWSDQYMADGVASPLTDAANVPSSYYDPVYGDGAVSPIKADPLDPLNPLNSPSPLTDNLSPTPPNPSVSPKVANSPLNPTNPLNPLNPKNPLNSVSPANRANPPTAGNSSPLGNALNPNPFPDSLKPKSVGGCGCPCKANCSKCQQRRWAPWRNALPPRLSPYSLYYY